MMDRNRVRWAWGLVVGMAVAWVASPGGEAQAAPPAPEETTEQRDQRMAWWREARFGMFIHWGLYAVPAGVWNGKEVPGIGEWIMHRARIPVSEYETLVPRFNPVRFNAREWARIARRAGMKYMVITSKHHDGFCLWDSKLTDYDIMATPFRRDIIRELSEACRAEGIRFGVYHSIMDWHHPAQTSDFPTYEKYLKGQVKELLTDCGPQAILWFDGEWISQWNREKGREMTEFIRSIQPDIIINNRVGKRHREDGDFGTPEQTIPATGIPGHDWETCMTMNDTWGFKSGDHHWKTVEDLLRKLVDIASKGGNFLLNVGPTAEGVIPPASVERLAAMGRWLEVNGESVYGTKASPFRRLPWGRCTSKPGRLYLHVFEWPDGPLEVPGLLNEVRGARLLADRDTRLRVTREGGRLLIALPAEAPDPIDTVVELEIEGEAKVDPTSLLTRPAADGSVTLSASEATCHGETVRYETGGGKDNLGFWTRKEDHVSWEFLAPEGGDYTVEVTFACDSGSGGSEYALRVGGAEVRARVEETGSWTRFVTRKVGRLRLEPSDSGRTLEVRPLSKPGLAVMNLRAIRLRPVEEGWIEVPGPAGATRWKVMHDAEFEVDGETGVLALVDGMGWLRSAQAYRDFVLEVDSRALVERYDSGIYFRAGAEGKPWPKTEYQINLLRGQAGTLVRASSALIRATEAERPMGEWNRWKLTVEGARGRLELNGRLLWSTESLEEREGFLGFQAENRAFEFRGLRIRRLR